VSDALFLALIGVQQITSVANFKTVIFKQYAAESAGRRFISLFPGLGYAAGYKVRERVFPADRYPKGLTEHVDSSTDIQIWWTTFRARLSCVTPWREVR